MMTRSEIADELYAARTALRREMMLGRDIADLADELMDAPNSPLANVDRDDLIEILWRAVDDVVFEAAEEAGEASAFPEMSREQLNAILASAKQTDETVSCPLLRGIERAFRRGFDSAH